jgi:hypothetical protein
MIPVEEALALLSEAYEDALVGVVGEERRVQERRVPSLHASLRVSVDGIGDFSGWL